MTIVSLLLPLLAGAGALAIAVPQLLGRTPPAVRAAFPWLPVGRPARWTLGAFALFVAVLMGASMAQPFLAFFAATLATVLFVGGLIALALRRPAAAVRSGRATTGGLLVVSVAVGLVQPLGLRVLCLPSADALPYEPVAIARVLKTYPAGTWFESVRVAPDGTIFLSANRGEDYQTGDKSRVVAQVIARSPAGEERVVFQLPAATTAGVLAIGAGGALYLTSEGAARGVWRLSLDGQAALIATLPEGSWPNGLCEGPDGQLYVADARRGAIWRIDPRTGAAAIARDDAALKARRFIALAPAANGLHVAGRDLFVTVSDAAHVLKLPLGDDGQLGAPTVFATGIPGDDFAVDTDGSLYVTTHPYNTVVRVAADGRRTMVADARQGVTGATDAAFGSGPDGALTLYVLPRGGAVGTGDPNAAGTLVALTLPAAR